MAESAVSAFSLAAASALASRSALVSLFFFFFPLSRCWLGAARHEMTMFEAAQHDLCSPCTAIQTKKLP